MKKIIIGILVLSLIALVGCSNIQDGEEIAQICLSEDNSSLVYLLQNDDRTGLNFSIPYGEIDNKSHKIILRVDYTAKGYNEYLLILGSVSKEKLYPDYKIWYRALCGDNAYDIRLLKDK